MSYNLQKMLLWSLFLLTIVGCEAQQDPSSVVWIGEIKIEEIDRKIQGSPFVEMLSKDHNDVIYKSDQVELFYKNFNLFNEPKRIIDWEKHYMIGKSSKPSYKYIELAKISYYSKEINDNAVLLSLRKKASTLGGTGIVGLFRKPLLAPTYNGNAYLFPGTSQKIQAYSYYGIVIRRCP